MGPLKGKSLYRLRRWKLVNVVLSCLAKIWTFLLAHRTLVLLVCSVYLVIIQIQSAPVWWRHAPWSYLPILYTTKQQFPVDEPSGISFENVHPSMPVHVSHLETAKYVNRTYSMNLNRAKRLRDLDINFLPTMTTSERTQMLVTLGVFVQVCNWNNITYFMLGGTLLGSYRHHGVIPWDDDVDVAVNASDWRKLRHVLTHLPGYTLYSPSKHQWKFFHNDALETDPKKRFKWPNVDIFFFTGDSTYMWGLTSGFLEDFFSRKSEVFPLQLRPFENMMVAVPCNTPFVIQQLFDMDMCATLYYRHKHNVIVEVINRRRCRDLFLGYPFVVRKQDHTGNIIETLKVGNRIIQEFTLPAFCTSK